MISKKRTIVTLTLCLFLAGCAAEKGTVSHGSSPALASWLSGSLGYKDMLELQKNTREPALIYFYASWCGYCRRFEKQVLSNPQVIRGISRTLKVRIDVDQSREIADAYRVSGIPKVFVRASNGRLQALRPSQSPENFLAQLSNQLVQKTVD